MVVILLILSVLSIKGTLYNKKTNNKEGFFLGCFFTSILVIITLIALYDTIIGI